MSRPIVFLSFANTRESHLPLLDKERQSILRSLLPLEDKEHFSIRHESAVTRDILRTYLTEYRERIILFHYAGHAGLDRLITSGGDAQGEGLAALLGSMPALQCVILNGCHTSEQTELLLKAGVPAVIGTSVPVSDHLATEFSIGFYQALATGSNLEAAYKAGRGSALLHQTDVHIPDRGVRVVDKVSGGEAWGFYYNPDDAAQWRLPDKPFVRTVLVSSDVVDGGGPDTPVNVELRQRMFEALAPYDSFLRFSWEQQRAGEEIELRIIQQKIIDALPVPLGQEVRRIFSSTEIGTERLELFVRAYRSLLQLLSYTLLAQLWDLLYAKPDHPLDDQLKAMVLTFLTTDDAQRTFDDYVGIIRTLRQHFTRADVEIFIDELEALSQKFNTSDTMQEAHRFLDTLRADLNAGKISDDQGAKLNHQSEVSLGTMFQELGIVCRYKFVTIKDIDLIKKRHQSPEFRIQKVNLDRLTAGLMDELRTETSFTDNHAVILLKSAKNFEEYLNLSPFLIDEHALIEKMQKSKLFIFSSFDEASGQINYHLVPENTPHAQLNSAVYPLVQGEFMAFRKAVLG